MHERIAQCPATDPPSAAQEHQAQARKDVPQHAAEPALGGEALPERGRVVHHVPLSRPLPSSVAREEWCNWTRQGPLRPPSARDASARGGVGLSGGGHIPCRAACIDASSSHQQRGHPLGPNTTRRPPGQVVTLERNGAWWWWWWLWGFSSLFLFSSLSLLSSLCCLLSLLSLSNNDNDHSSSRLSLCTHGSDLPKCHSAWTLAHSL